MAADFQKECDELHQLIKEMRSDWVVYGDDDLLPLRAFEETSLAKKMEKLREDLADILPADALDDLQSHMEDQYNSWMDGFPIVKDAWDAGFEKVLRSLDEDKTNE